MANCWLARPPQWQPHQRHATPAPAAAAFYSVKSRQGLGLGGLDNPGSRELYVQAGALLPNENFSNLLPQQLLLHTWYL